MISKLSSSAQQHFRTLICHLDVYPLTECQHCFQAEFSTAPQISPMDFAQAKSKVGERRKNWEVCMGQRTYLQNELLHLGITQVIVMGWIQVRRGCQEQPASCPDHLTIENHHPKLVTQTFHLKTKWNIITIIQYLHKTCLPISPFFHCLVWTEP